MSDKPVATREQRMAIAAYLIRLGINQERAGSAAWELLELAGFEVTP